MTSDATRAHLVAPAVADTDERGRFRFEPSRQAHYDVTATAEDQGYGHVEVDSRDPSAKAEHLVIDLSGCEHVVSGRVLDASGGVVAGASIALTRGRYFGTRALPAAAISDSSGGYRICVRPGPVTLLARAQGYGAIFQTTTVQGEQSLDFAMIPEAILAVRAIDAESGKAVAGVEVTLAPVSWTGAIHSTVELGVTGRDGRVRFEGVAPGRHRLFAGGADSASAPTSILVLPGEEAEIVLQLEARVATVRGVVVAGGSPLAGARVAATRGGHLIGTTSISDGDGRFTLTRLSPGPVEFDVRGYEVESPATAVAPSTAPVTVAVRRQGTIRGRVERRGAPVARAQVFAFSPALTRGGAGATTDLDGRFELAGLPPGTYRLSAVSEERRAFTDDGVSIAVGAGEEKGGVVIELGSAASISGTVLDEDDEAVAGVAVRYTHRETGDLCRAVTDSAGRFNCDMMTGGGTYVPVVRPEDRSTIHFPLAAPSSVELPGPDSHVDGQVLRVAVSRRVISGRVVSSGGGPYPDVRVRAIDAGAGYAPAAVPWPQNPGTVTDADGRFEVEVWGGGRYTVHARAPGGNETTRAGVEAGTDGVVLELDQPGRIRGRLVGFDRFPRVTARRATGGSELFEARVEGQGFAIDGLEPGRYAVVASAGSDGASQAVEVRAGQLAELTLRAGPAARFSGKVIDFTSGEPVGRVSCRVAPHVSGAPTSVPGWDAPVTTSDDAGRFSLEGPSGSVEAICFDSVTHSGGAAQLTAAAGEENEVEIAVVRRVPGRFNGIGARFVSAEAAEGGFAHTVAELRPGGSAAAAGIRVGDRVVAVDGRSVAPLTRLGLTTLLGNRALGDEVALTVERAGQRRPIRVTIEAPWW